MPRRRLCVAAGIAGGWAAIINGRRNASIAGWGCPVGRRRNAAVARWRRAGAGGRRGRIFREGSLIVVPHLAVNFATVTAIAFLEAVIPASGAAILTGICFVAYSLSVIVAGGRAAQIRSV